MTVSASHHKSDHIAAHPDSPARLAILGSCVSRDIVEFAQGIEVTMYWARQSVASMASTRVADETLSRLTLTPGIAAFHQRCIEQDFTKSTLIKLVKIPRDIPVMIDLIEERTPLGRTACGSIVTLSEAATRFSNAEALVTETIAPWSDEHVRLFEASMAKLTRAVGSRPTILHRAFYAENRSAHPQINRALEHFYDLVAKALPHAVIVEVDESLRCAEDDHKWGSGPFHYIDAYYRTALAALRPCLKGAVADRVGFSLKGAAGG